eukprot:m.56242 g.56242  ORF g.56242 m.56242 type:complete len:116 (+) comp9294_c0_seq4:2352-2699(+)
MRFSVQHLFARIVKRRILVGRVLRTKRATGRFSKIEKPSISRNRSEQGFHVLTSWNRDMVDRAMRHTQKQHLYCLRPRSGIDSTEDIELDSYRAPKSPPPAEVTDGLTDAVVDYT